MAEVGQGLRSGVTRLSALRISQSRSVPTGGSPGCLPITCASGNNEAEEELAQNEREVSKIKTTRRKSEKLSKVGKSRSLQEDVTLLCAASLGPSPYRFIGFVETRESLQSCKTALYLSTGLLQEKLLPSRLTPWTRGALSIHPDAFRTHQQLRAFCTVVFFLAEQGSERSGATRRRRSLKSDPYKGSTTTRSYSWSSDSVALLHRSKTAYYDILKVSPSATQSQIKTAYYKQSFIYHPDKNAGSREATQRFSEVSEAYNVLGNVNLRRKYDRGILSQSDVQSAGRPSSKDTTTRSTGSSQQQQQQQQRARHSTQVGGRPIFDFDAFYRAHYGDQLQKEREMKARRQAMQKQKEKQSKWKERKMVELVMMMGLLAGGAILTSLGKSLK